ncbi:MAG: PIG-L family deacetylase [Anaerolineae bacterium]|nr:PIG-L family deacetylase [Anaerolineae bacterium]
MHLFLSPHFDDAVLSCGGTIHQLTQKGELVTVRTVMGGSPPLERVPDSPIVRDLHIRWKQGDDPVSARAKEDETAVTSLGAVLKRMTVWIDCVYRTNRKGEALYLTEAAIFGDIHPEDTTGKWLPSVVLPPDEAVHFIYVPLGVGHHVDHQIVRNWGLELVKQNPWVALKFYEEYPYTQDQNALERALAFYEGLSIKLKRETVNLTEANIAAKVQAIRKYESQISTFWESAEAMEIAVRRSLRENDQNVERYWSMVRE